MKQVGNILAWVLLTASMLSAQEQGKPREARPEALSPEKFSEAHGSLFDRPKSNEAAELTDRLLGSEPGSQPGTVKRRNFIDDHIFGKMERDGVPHARPASDIEFLRRVTLDLTGRIPTRTEVRAFLADKDPDKRDTLIDRLLDGEEYVEKWAYHFMDLFRANGKMGRGQHLFHFWMKQNLRADRPYDQVAYDIISASAKSNHVVAASNVIAREHIQGAPQPKDGDDLGMVHQLDTHDELAIHYAKIFMGLNLSCISCHDGQGHLEEVNVWLSTKSRAEFFQLAAFLGRSRYQMYFENGQPQSGEFLLDDGSPGYDTEGESMVRVARLGGPDNPVFLLSGEEPQPGEEPREALGRILTAHPQFARGTVNRFWAKLMGFGIVEPFDEFDLLRQDPDNLPEGWELQPSHPELLEELARSFRESNYSIKELMRTITRSSAYRLSARFQGEWSDSYAPYFARKFVRRLGAEELHDAIALATDRPGDFKFGDNKVGLTLKLAGPPGARDVRTFLRTFGQSDRNTPPREVPGSLLHPLALMQSPVVTDRVIAKEDSRLKKLLDSYDNDRVVDEMFLGTLSRPPSSEEKTVALAALNTDRVSGAENLQWALINSVEFFFNY
ncbi:MAG: DUF1549 domain-containing protein [Acidobacteriota bacterium]|nr:DUF1549 domain-containing protein [Acidobacteriota bacterium]